METLNFDAIYTKYHKNILTYITFKNIPYNVAEELTNDTFMKAYKALNTFDSSKSNIKTWLTNIAHNAMIDYIRVEKNRMYSEISLDSCMEDTENHESMANVLSFRSQKSAIKTDYKIENQQFMSRVKGLFSKMNKTQKQIAELFLLSDVSQVEIAKIMDIPINSVKGNLTRIREIVGSNFEAERVEYGFKDILAKNSYKQ